MNKKEVAATIDRLVDKSLFDLSDVPTGMLERLKACVDREIDKRKDEPKVRLIAVGDSHFIDKYFSLEDEELANQYAIKRLKGQIEGGKSISVSMSYEVVKESDVEGCLSIKGAYE